jgi:hypothetical protein
MIRSIALAAAAGLAALTSINAFAADPLTQTTAPYSMTGASCGDAKGT